VIAPVDYEQIKKAVWTISSHTGPVYLRMTKPDRSVITTTRTPFEIGVPQVFADGGDVTVVASGVMVSEALRARQELSTVIDVAVINVHTLKPFVPEVLLASARKTGRVVVAEEHSIIGGLGSLVAETMSEHLPVPVVRVGMKDKFSESGDPEKLMSKYQMDYKSIIKEIKQICQK
jgi:transketolase